MSDVLKILTSKDKEEVRQAIKEMLLNQIEMEFEENYIINISDLEEWMEEILEEIKEEIRPVVKEHMFNEMKKKLGIE